MNIKREIVDRALEAAGQERLNDEDIEKDSARWRLIKDNYLSVILTTLAKTAWTSRLTRVKLTKLESPDAEQETIPEGALTYKCNVECYWNGKKYHVGDIVYLASDVTPPEYFELIPDAPTPEPVTPAETKENYSSYLYVYKLPIDCAKPEELQDNAEFNVEGNYLYTNQEDAILLYVSNGKREADPEEDTSEEETEETDSEETTEEESEEDYPDYDDIDFDPNLSEYIELQLAAKIALKITGDMNTFGILYNQAIVVENNAKKATLEHAHSKEKGAAWWGDQMGLKVEAN